MHRVRSSRSRGGGGEFVKQVGSETGEGLFEDEDAAFELFVLDCESENLPVPIRENGGREMWVSLLGGSLWFAERGWVTHGGGSTLGCSQRHEACSPLLMHDSHGNLRSHLICGGPGEPKSMIRLANEVSSSPPPVTAPFASCMVRTREPPCCVCVSVCWWSPQAGMCTEVRSALGSVPRSTGMRAAHVRIDCATPAAFQA